nr:putative ribonuclease H-like domain-containing protein [Tanacetum cinerariifolium]
TCEEGKEFGKMVMIGSKNRNYTRSFPVSCFRKVFDFGSSYEFGNGRFNLVSELRSKRSRFHYWIPKLKPLVDVFPDGFKWQMTMISMRIKKFHKRTGRKLQFDTKDPVSFDKTKVECFNCHKMGHFTRDCRAKGNQHSRKRDDGYNGNKTRDNGRRPAYQDDSKALVTIDGEDIDWSGHVEEGARNYVMMAYSSSNLGSDNETPADDSDSKPSKYASCESDSSIETSTSMPEPVENALKVVCEPKVWTDAPIIEEYESDSDNNSVSNVQEYKEKPSFAFTDSVNHVKTSRENIKETGTTNHSPKIEKQDRNCHTRKDDPYRALKDKGIVDIGCSRHMIGNKAHLADYQEFKGGSVAFGAESLRKEATHDIQNASTSSTNLLSTAGPSRSFNDGELSYPDDPSMAHFEDIYASPIAHGHRKEEGIDYDEVFALVARIEAIRIFLAFTSYMGFIVYQIDVKSAFLYGTIDEEVYVSQPPGFVDHKFLNKVYKVVKALYGLHQAPRAWYATLSTFLEISRYRRRAIDKTLFIKQDKKDIMLVQVYVDDIIFGSTKKYWCDEFEELIKNRFQMSSMGELTFFPKLQVKQKEDGIFIRKDKYVAEILKKFNFLSVKTASTPIETQKPLVKDEEAADMDVTPKTSHLEVVKRIFRKSTTRGCQFIVRRLILWQCKKQTIMAIYTTEAEYVAAAHCCGQVLWIQNQLLDYGFNFMNTKIYIDNESTICIVKKLVFHSKTNHIEIRHHFIRDAYENKLIQVLKIHTDDNVVDLLTKAFDVSKFNFLVVNTGLLNL